MQRDINFARHVMQADFEQKLQQKSIDLWVIICMQMRYLNTVIKFIK